MPFPGQFIGNYMTEWLYCISLAGIPIEIRSRYELNIFGDFLTKETPILSIPLINEHRMGIPGQCYSETEIRNIELFELASAVSNKLLSFNRVIFHGVAFLWHEKAWILTAPSGTGKTTQYALWKKLYGEEIELINGDKPILSVNDDGRIYVYSSPWCGKERMHQLLKAPLGGMILLKRAMQNNISCLEKGEAVIPIYKQFLYCPDEDSTALKVCELEEKLLDSCRVWLLENRGNEASAEMTHDCLLHYLEDNHT